MPDPVGFLTLPAELLRTMCAGLPAVQAFLGVVDEPGALAASYLHSAPASDTDRSLLIVDWAPGLKLDREAVDQRADWLPSGELLVHFERPIESPVVDAHADDIAFAEAVSLMLEQLSGVAAAIVVLANGNRHRINLLEFTNAVHGRPDEAEIKGHPYLQSSWIIAFRMPQW